MFKVFQNYPKSLQDTLHRFLQYISILSRPFLGKWPVLLVHLSSHQPISRNANSTILSDKEGKPLFPTQILWYDAAVDWPCDFTHIGVISMISMIRPGIEPVTSLT